MMPPTLYSFTSISRSFSYFFPWFEYPSTIISWVMRSSGVSVLNTESTHFDSVCKAWVNGPCWICFSVFGYLGLLASSEAFGLRRQPVQIKSRRQIQAKTRSNEEAILPPGTKEYMKRKI